MGLFMLFGVIGYGQGTLTINNEVTIEGGDLTFNVTYTGAIVVGGFTVTPSFVDVTALGGVFPFVDPTDYENVISDLAFDGTSPQTLPFTLRTNDDVISELQETFNVTLSASDGTVDDTATATGTINDNDTVAFTTTASNGLESVSSADLEVSLNGLNSSDVTVNYTVTGTATGGGTDYTLANGVLTIIAGNLTNDITIASIVDDLIDEPNETVVVTLSGPTNANLGTNTVHTYTITDNDPTPTVAFTTTASSGLESVSSADLEVSLSGLSGSNVTVNYTVTGTATGGGTDYTLANGVLTITSGNLTGDITIASIVDDLIAESPDETVVVTLSGPTNATLGTNTQHTYTITDNDGTPTVAFTTTASNGLESVSSADLEVSLSGLSGSNVTVNYTVTGTATGGGTDYTLANGVLTITSGNLTGDITIASIVDDLIDEPNETVVVTLSGPTNATLGTNTQHTYTITDNDGTPTVAFTTTASNGLESVSSADLEVSLSGLSGSNVTVNYTVTGTATGGGTDYTLANGVLTITSGNLTGDITIASIVDDLIAESPDETVVVTLSGPTNATLGTNTQHTYTITDNDGTPTVAFTTTASNGLESVSSADLEVSLSGLSGSDVTVNYAVTGTATGGGTDYTLANGQLTITSGNLTGDITIASIVDDVIAESPDETVVVTLSGPTNATLGTNTEHTYTITDNDGTPTVAFTTTASNGLESVSSADLEVSLSGLSGSDVTVNYAVTGTATGGGVDYTLANGQLTITSGNLTGDITIASIVDDLIAESPDETVVVTLSGPTNANLGTNTVHTYTINDNDGTPTVAFTTTASNGLESVSSADLEVSLNGLSGSDVTVNYAVTGTATGGGVDYTLANGQLTITSGNLTGDITIASIVDDVIAESPDETVVVTLSGPTNANLGTNTVHTYTINDNDGTPTVAFTTTASNGLESVSSADLEVSLNGLSGSDVTVNYAVTGTATGGGVDYTLANGQLTITSGNLTGDITIASIVDDVIAESPDETVVVTLSGPTNATLGTNTQHTYTITDNDGTPTVAFTTTASNGLESVSSADLEVSLSGLSGSNVTVNYTVTGTATGGGTDYTLANGVLTIIAGNLTNDITIASIVDDLIDEPNETVVVTLSGPTNATLGTNTVHTYTITDNDGTPTVAFTTTASNGLESVSSADLEVSLSGLSGSNVTVNYTVTGTATGGGTDYTLANGVLTITSGNLTGDITISSIVDDLIAESPDETVVVTLSGPTNATLGTNTQHTYTINDNESAGINITPTTGLTTTEAGKRLPLQ